MSSVTESGLPPARASPSSAEKDTTVPTQSNSHPPVGGNTQKSFDHASFPDGGLQAWLTVAGAPFSRTYQISYTSSFGVYQDFYVREYITNVSPSAVSWIGSTNAFITIAGGVISGRLYDRGYFYHLIWGGCSLSVFSLFMLSLAKPNHYYQVFLAHGIGAGLGGGIIYIPSVAVMSQYFQRRRALAMTIVASGASLGAVIHPIMLNHLFHSKLGFGNSVRASAGLVGGLLLIACCLMRTRLPVQKKHVDQRQILRKLVKDKPYVFTSLALFTFSIGFYFPQFYLQLDATTHHLSPTFSFYSLVIVNFCSGFGRIASGLVANKINVADMVVVSSFAISVVIFGMIGLASVTSVVLIGVFYGFFIGIYVGLNGPLLVMLTSDLSELGVRMGIAYLFSGLGNLIGPPISGALLTDKFIWWKPAVFNGAMTMLGASFYLLMAIFHRRALTTGASKS
ncbi:hypothetical protein D9613_003703 [Agrocybe pediades]|uniref:Major facilitator superfamily (MFS) profile domain-containing protein n=1 Tax=Agrocybe pediades TaxID=84607 RepID=A0A8H4VIN6_9AGAR|nr:hypothetical protein D9613_003703 [Agrocybe pediades]